MGDVKNPSTMERNFFHSLKKLFNVHTLEIRDLFLGKGMGLICSHPTTIQKMMDGKQHAEVMLLKGW